MKELPKAYEPAQYEDGVYQAWEASGFFAPEAHQPLADNFSQRKCFSMVLPPPNVTGTLHMGHAVMLAIQDVLARYHRMKGDRTLWVPGTDHAAIATQSKVEKLLLEKEGKTKYDLGREAFLQRVEQFAQESHDTIVNQCKKMGASLDWSREAYTLDDKRNLAVRTVFKKMYDDALIYRGYRVVNWSVKGQSTCSDDELVHVERQAKLYIFKYNADFPIPVASTRPETKLGDTAVAVHPKGKWQKYIGQIFEVRDVGQPGHGLHIQIIADEGVDENFGTGALGVTPAHSMIDFEMYQRQKAAGNPIELIQVIGEDGKMTPKSGAEYAGLEVSEAREKFVQYLRDNNLLLEEKDIVQNVGTSDRFKDVVEPLPKLQWFMDVNKKFILPKSNLDGIKDGQEVTLKELMQQVVRTKQIEIIPNRFEKTYFNWIDNLRDWCISRQLWFGHRVPVWYRGSETYCGTEAPVGDSWTQDSDTLDTWFSSGLWTFSTLGWPEETIDLKTFHPISVLETGYDILFFWVARMILMTTYTLGTIPFKTVYLHGLVRDEQGRKMSKSLDNIMDPLDMIAKYGTDATRLSLLIGNTPGNDTKLSEEKVAGFRNFTNKLWNISRFMLLNISNPDPKLRKGILPATNEASGLADAWIVHRLERVRRDVTENLEKFNFSYAGERLRDFTWNELADWYLEIAKIEGGKDELLNYIFNTILKLWHPFMPFVTEAIWREVYGQQNLIMIERWPTMNPLIEEFGEAHYFEHLEPTMAEADFTSFQEIVTTIRSARADNKIEPAKKIAVYVKEKTPLCENNAPILKALARIGELTAAKDIQKPEGAITLTAGGVEIFIDLAGAVDTEKEKIRLQTELAEAEKYCAVLEKKLANHDFIARAPAAVVDQEKEKYNHAKERLTKLQHQLAVTNTL